MSTAHSEAPTMVQEPAAPDGLVGELLARRRKRLPRLTLALIVLVGAAVAFIGGAEVQKHFGTVELDLERHPVLLRTRVRRRQRAQRRVLPRLRRRQLDHRHRHADQGHDALCHERRRQHRPRQDIAAIARHQVRRGLG